MEIGILITISFGYLLILFMLAYVAERKTEKLKRFSPFIYSLSIGVYCSAWAFYGSIGKATQDGLEFLAVYIGPTIAAPVCFLLLRKIIRISKAHRITSLADFISARYGKKAGLGTLVTIVCVIGLVPYIALQIKAIVITFGFLIENVSRTNIYSLPDIKIIQNIALWITISLAVFVMFFGTRRIDSAEKHEGLIAAVAFESLVKLLAFLIGGIFIVYFLFDGVADIFQQIVAQKELKEVLILKEQHGYLDWTVIGLLSAMAVILLPRQFQVSVVENTDERHLNKSLWLFPLYMFLINLLVFPVALVGYMLFGNSVQADYAILSIPFLKNNHWIALIVYLGGFSAATGMIIVETIALSTMFSNNLLLPVILKVNLLKNAFLGNAEKAMKIIRRFSIALILLLAYQYFAKVAESYSLVSTGLISFAAVAQFAPAVIVGLFWRRGNHKGALYGIIAGVLIWFYTLVVPAIIGVGILPQSILNEGLFGWELLKPFSLFGLTGLTPLTHSFFWSLFFNLMIYVICSLYLEAGKGEEVQARLFVDVFKYQEPYEISVKRKGKAKLSQILFFLQQFLGEDRTQHLLKEFESKYQIQIGDQDDYADQRLLIYAEKVLSGVVGAASSKILIESILKDEEISLSEVVELIKESQQLLQLNKELEQASSELKLMSESLILVNQKMKETEVLKDDFLYSITHELRTPLTSIRAFSEILYDNPDIEEKQRQEFLATMIKEIERLSKLITRVLDLERLESGKQQINKENILLSDLIAKELSSLSQLFNEKGFVIDVKVSPEIQIQADKDLLAGLLQNLFSNAIKYVDAKEPSLKVTAAINNEKVLVSIEDNGSGIAICHRENIFSKFYQINSPNHKGSGLGLAICKRIVEIHGGNIWVSETGKEGACFCFDIPLKA